MEGALNLLAQAAKGLTQFLMQLLLGILAALLYIIPWLLRAASVVGWLASAFIALRTVNAIYSPFSDQVPVFALQFAVILLTIAWAMIGLMDGRDIWGLLAAGGFVMSALSYGAAWLMETWAYADLFFRVLPVSLLAVGMITISVRARKRRFMWEAAQ